MKYTLLEMTQTVLSSMDSDEINSIDDTPESKQVVQIIKTVIDDLTSRGDLASNKTPFNLVPSGDVLKPVLMHKPSTIDRVEWIKYNCLDAEDIDPVWNDMRYLPIEDFIIFTHQYNVSENNVDSFDYTSDGFTFTFNFRNDTAPQYYTSFNDSDIIFDAYDSEVDATLQASKTLCFGSKRTNFEEVDEFVPNLLPQQFALVINEAKSLAWAELKQMPHAKAEVSSRRNWRHLQKTRQTVPDGTRILSGAHNFDKLPNFGRK